MNQFQTEELFPHREDFKDMITNHIETFDSGVYCISAKWGMGKTFLINKIMKDFPKGKKPFYFDAWKYDKYGNPLVAFCMELITGENKVLMDNFQEESKIQINKIYEELEKNYGAKLNDLKLVDGILDINKHYYNFAKILKDEGIVFIIDEFNCLNSHFVASILEVIKHFFQDVLIYLVADRVVLLDTLNNYYGFNSGNEYLEKIFDDTFLLPEVPNGDNKKEELINNYFNNQQDNYLLKVVRNNLDELSIRQLERVSKEELITSDLLFKSDYIIENMLQRIAYVIDAMIKIEKVSNFKNYTEIISNVKNNQYADVEFIQRCKNILENEPLRNRNKTDEIITMVLKEVVTICNY